MFNSIHDQSYINYENLQIKQINIANNNEVIANEFIIGQDEDTHTDSDLESAPPQPISTNNYQRNFSTTSEMSYLTQCYDCALSQPCHNCGMSVR